MKYMELIFVRTSPDDGHQIFLSDWMWGRYLWSVDEGG